MSKRVEVSAGLVFHKGKLLITQRYPDAHLPNMWEFPGGKREPHESFEQCLVRELREELGIDTEPLSLYDEIRHDYPDKLVHLKFFICRLLSGEAKPLGCQAVAWVEQQELSCYPFPDADAQLLSKLQNNATLWKT